MIANYHTHTYRCHHASGTEREYVENSIKGGLKILGFSDHTPYPFPEGYYSSARMSMGELDGYVDTVLALKKEYADDIEIHLGLEAEYYPSYFQKLTDHLKDYPIEYLILGQHNLNDEMGDFYCGLETKDPAKLIRYVDQCEEAMDHGNFLYLAHPDLCYFTGDEEVYVREYTRLCRIAKAHNKPIEINFYGIIDKRHYPNPRFWEIASKEHMDVVFGCDVHQADRAVQPTSEKIALDMVKKYNLNLIEQLALPEHF